MNARAAIHRCIWSLVAATTLAPAAHAEWQRDDTSLAWHQDGRVLWRFSFDPQKGKPFFDPVSVTAGHSLTNFKPEDHPWHYGLWFSWKYINGANYWEENRQTGKAEGSTRWSNVRIDARPDGSADISMDLTYTHPSGRVDMTESRVLQVSAPDASGGYSIDWSSDFLAGSDGAVLDRTAMPGEQDGKVNGGYAGLSVRLAGAPAAVSVVTAEGPVEKFESDRARPASGAIAANLTLKGRPIGGLAIFSNPSNVAARAPWYVINSHKQMRFICAAVLAPAVRTLVPHGEWKLNYRIAVQPSAWTSEALAAASAQWNKVATMHSRVIEWNEVPARQSEVRTLRQFFQSPTATLDELEMHVTTLAPGTSSHPPHQHANEELVILREGTLEAYSHGVWKRIGPGSVIFNASNEWHAVRNVGDGPATYHVINWRSAPKPEQKAEQN